MIIIENNILLKLIRENETNLTEDFKLKIECMAMVEKLANVNVKHILDGDLDEVRKLDPTKTLVRVK